MGQFVTTTCPNPDCGREKDVWVNGREIRAGTRCGRCGHAWEIDLAEYY